MTTTGRPAEAGALRTPSNGAMSAVPRPPFGRPHILIVNGHKVSHPVFILGAPCSGTVALAAAIKRSPGFHLTLGHRWVLPVVHAFARSPAIARDRPHAAATVLRDAFAQGWQVSPDSCLGCTQACRDAGGTTGAAPCVDQQAIGRYGDASPDLLYCAESLIDAFPDARLVQIIRDGRDVVTAMLGDPTELTWFHSGLVNLDGDSDHPVLGVETHADRLAWPKMSLVAKCAMRWRGTVRLAARLRNRLASEQLITLRYEEMVRQPAAAVSAVSAFIGAQVGPVQTRPASATMEPGVWRRLLSPTHAAEIERVAGEELRRVGYGP